jgi:FKBP-type peptidyl-prolyl cis-trans isomerase
MAMRAKESESAIKESADFLAKNKQKEGVQTTESGLQYELIEKGTGASPDENDMVTVHYTGKTVNGNVFDSSVERGEPVTFGVNQVIPGWTEGLQLMQEGGKARFYIPSELGYGERGAGPDIPPHSALIFDVELISVEKVD